MKAYKIRDSKTGLFSTGTCSPKWKKYGKTWSSTGAVRNHLRQFMDASWNKQGIPETWEVLEYAVEPTAVFGAKAFLAGISAQIEGKIPGRL